MELKQVCDWYEGITLVRDGCFDATGFMNIFEIENILVFLRDGNYMEQLLSNPCVSAVICLPEFADIILKKKTCGIITCDNPEKIFYKLHNFLYKENGLYKKKKWLTRIGQNCSIDPSAVIAENNVVIGDNVVVEPGAIIMEDSKIGDNCVIGAGTVIGTRGFQYYRDGDDALYIEHIGGVVLENNVEVLSGCCIARGLIKPTYISENCKIDNLVHVGHSAFLDKRVLVTAGAIIGGSCHIGKRVWVGINSVIAASVHIGDDAFICMGSAVTRDVENKQKVSGNFAIDHKKQIANIKKISS